MAKSVEAWAVVQEDGDFEINDLFNTKFEANAYVMDGEHIIKVRITEIVPKGRKGGTK